MAIVLVGCGIGVGVWLGREKKTMVVDQSLPTMPVKDQSVSTTMGLGGGTSKQPSSLARVSPAPNSTIASVLPLTPAPPASPPASNGTVIGTAWISRENGSSDLQRGLEVQVLRRTATRASILACMTQEASAWQSSPDDNYHRAKESRASDAELNRQLGTAEPFDSGKIWQESGDHDKAGAIAIGTAMASVPAEMDLQALHHLLTKLAQFESPNLGRAVADAMLVQGSTDSDGKYKLDGLPPGSYYVHATIDTRVFFVEWLIPINVDAKSVVKVDLFNNNALLIHNSSR